MKATLIEFKEGDVVGVDDAGNPFEGPIEGRSILRYAWRAYADAHPIALDEPSWLLEWPRPERLDLGDPMSRAILWCQKRWPKGGLLTDLGLDGPVTAQMIDRARKTSGTYLRRLFQTGYAFAIPNAEAIAQLARLGPIVELGAGLGYWAWILRSMGVDVVAYDAHPPPDRYNLFFPSSPTARERRSSWGDSGQLMRGRWPWSPVKRGDIRDMRKHSDRALFLCWPPRANGMANRAIRAYRGDVIAHVGELGGCTGDEDTIDVLARRFRKTDEVKLPAWPPVSDFLTIWKR